MAANGERGKIDEERVLLVRAAITLCLSQHRAALDVEARSMRYRSLEHHDDYMHLSGLMSLMLTLPELSVIEPFLSQSLLKQVACTEPGFPGLLALQLSRDAQYLRVREQPPIPDQWGRCVLYVEPYPLSLCAHPVKLCAALAQRLQIDVGPIQKVTSSRAGYVFVVVSHEAHDIHESLVEEPGWLVLTMYVEYQDVANGRREWERREREYATLVGRAQEPAKPMAHEVQDALQSHKPLAPRRNGPPATERVPGVLVQVSGIATNSNKSKIRSALLQACAPDTVNIVYVDYMKGDSTAIIRTGSHQDAELLTQRTSASFLAGQEEERYWHAL